MLIQLLPCNGNWHKKVRSSDFTQVDAVVIKPVDSIVWGWSLIVKLFLLPHKVHDLRSILGHVAVLGIFVRPLKSAENNLIQVLCALGAIKHCLHVMLLPHALASNITICLQRPMFIK